MEAPTIREQRSRSRAVAVPLIAVLLALLPACGGSLPGTATANGSGHHATKTPDPSTAPTQKPPPPKPKLHTCRSLTYADISHLSNDSPTTSCSKPHTSYTFAVHELPHTIAFRGVDIGNDSIQSAAARACRTSFTGFIGGDASARALARVTPTYFVPSQDAFNRGAHWVRCDVVALQSAGALAPLPTQVRGLLNSPHRASQFDVCALGEPGTPSAGLVMCSQPHAFRAVAALRLGGGNAPYPGTRVTRNNGERRCEDLLRSMLGPSAGYTYTWTYPSPSDWRSGQRFGYCWRKTSS